ncbi:MAG TPA: glycosyltransferase family 2 protein [Gaiellaceae bacterium]|nr:glycosyltransferase family 2 protein [Gaiellaceae bacterium]
MDTGASLLDGLPTLPEQPTVSVITCAYTEERLGNLHKLLIKLLSQSYPPMEVIAVVDGNGPLAMELRASFPDVCVVENEGARGHAGAANHGLGVARGEVVAFIDDDAVPADNDWLASLVNAYDRPVVLGVGGLIEPNWLTARPRWFPDEFLWVVGASHRGLPRQRSSVRNLWMGNMSVRRSVLDRIGGFRTSLSRVGTRPFGVQETELCIRAAQHWPTGVFVHEPRARVVHEVPAARTTFRYFRTHCYDEAFAKVSMARYVGSQDGLSSEREYLMRILPAGVARGVGDALLRRDPAGLGRAAAILVGTAAAGCGYARARFLGPRTVHEEDVDPRVLAARA